MRFKLFHKIQNPSRWTEFGFTEEFEYKLCAICVYTACNYNSGGTQLSFDKKNTYLEE